MIVIEIRTDDSKSVIKIKNHFANLLNVTVDFIAATPKDSLDYDLLKDFELIPSKSEEFSALLPYFPRLVDFSTALTANSMEMHSAATEFVEWIGIASHRKTLE